MVTKIYTLQQQQQHRKDMIGIQYSQQSVPVRTVQAFSGYTKQLKRSLLFLHKVIRQQMGTVGRGNGELALITTYSQKVFLIGKGWATHSKQKEFLWNHSFKFKMKLRF